MNVLLTCAGRRHYLARFIKETIGVQGRLIGTDMSVSAAALTVCDNSYMLPAVSDADYVQKLLSICKEEKIDYVFSVNDLELPILAEYAEHIYRESGAVCVVSSRKVIDICGDKYLTYLRLKEMGVSTPHTFISVETVLAAMDEGQVRFPMMVKPRWGSASIGLRIVHDENSLKVAYEECANIVESGILAALGTVAESRVIIQEFIRGQEFGIDILNGIDGNLIGYCAKKKLAARAGETDKAVTVNPLPFASTVGALAKGLGHVGNLDCDCIEYQGEFYVIDMNPRFGGGYPFSHLAGANHIEFLLKPESLVDRTYLYEIGMAFAKCDHLVSIPFAV